MSKKKRTRFLIIWAASLALVLAGIFLTAPEEGHEESLQAAMRDAVLHETNQISFLGMEVNPAVVSAYTVSGFLLFAALLIRIFAVPRFKMVPGRFQSLLEAAVSFFDNLAKSNSPHRNRFLGAYVFAAGVYICTSTVFELLGLQVLTTEGVSMSMPAPLADINGALMMGCLSYLVILSGGIAENGIRGIGKTLKEFSLPVSMSFRLFGAMMSGLLVTDLVYHYITLSFVLPVLVGVLFTLLHALIQAYVLTMLTTVFYGEVSEPAEKHGVPKKAAVH